MSVWQNGPMTGVQFVTDSRGGKVAVLIDLKKHGASLGAGGFVNSYAVELKPTARKELESLPNTALARVVRKIESFAPQPRPAGCKKLRGYKDLWRVRIGDWRIVYIINDATRSVSVTE